MHRRWLMIFLLAVMVLSACSGQAQSTPAVSGAPQQVSSDGHITLEFWYALSGDSGKAVEALVEKYNQSQSKVTVKATYQGDYSSSMAKVWSAITGGGLPNVAQIGGAPLLASTGAIESVDALMAGENGVDKTKIYQAFWDYNSTGGKIWSMPFNHSLPVLYYNRDLFTKAGLDPEKPPKTWDEMIQMAQKLTADTDQNGQVDQWGFNTDNDSNSNWYISTMFLSNGAQIVNPEETEVIYNSPEAVDMLSLWGDFVSKHKIMPPNQHNEAKGDFLAGKLGMMLGSSASIPSIESQANFKVGVGVIPGVSGKDEKIPIGGASLVLFKGANSDVQKAAWDFIKYMSSSESSVYLSTHTGYLPIYTDAAASAEISAYLKEHPNRTVPMESLKYAVAIPEFSALGTSDSALRQAVQSVELQSATAQEALDKAKKTVDQSIKSQSATN